MDSLDQLLEGINDPRLIVRELNRLYYTHRDSSVTKDLLNMVESIERKDIVKEKPKHHQQFDIEGMNEQLQNFGYVV